MNKKAKNKKALVSLILAAALLATTALTYAWFTGQANADVIVDMGDLKVETTLTADENNPVIVEPGITLDYSGVITNKGAIPTGILIDYSKAAKVTIKSDSNGNPLPADEYYTIDADPALFELVFDESTLGWGMKEDGSEMYQWFSVNDQPGVYFLLLYGQNLSTPEVSYSVVLDGPGIKNHYMNAELTIGSTWKATQALEAAIEDELGLVVYGPDSDVTALNPENFTPFSIGGPSQAQVLAFFEALLSR